MEMLSKDVDDSGGAFGQHIPSCLHALDVSPSAAFGPTARLTCVAEFAVNAGRAGARPGPSGRSGPHDNHPTKVRWSPDGVSLLTCGADDLSGLAPPSVPVEGADGDGDAGGNRTADAALAPDALWPALRIKEREAVRDYAWYPVADARDPASCVFVTACRATPVHLWDAVTGALRASYLAYDHLDEPTAGLAVCFSADGARVFAGYDGAVRSWDVSRPGRDCDVHVTRRKGKRRRGRGEDAEEDGQGGIISCFAASPASGGLLAAGSYGKTTGVYHEATGEHVLTLRGQRGGVTHARWSPDGNYLYTGARRDGEILCWDVRHARNVVYRCVRASEDSNQRIGFDIEPCGRHLVSGGTDGCLRAYDLTDGSEVGAWRAAEDTVSDWAFHPSASFVPQQERKSGNDVGGVPRGASVSGHRHFRSRADDEESAEGEGTEGADSVQRDREMPTNALRVWDYSCTVIPLS